MRDSIPTFAATLQRQQPLYLPSAPVCTMPPSLQPVISHPLLIHPVRSPVAVVPLESPQCIHVKLPPTTIHHLATNASLEPCVPNKTATPPSATKLLQLLPRSDNGKDGIPDVNEPPVYVLDSTKSNSDTLLVYVRRSPRIQKAYDGVHINSVD